MKQLLPSVSLAGRLFPADSMTNVRPSILSRTTSNLLQQPGHPLQRIKARIYNHFTGRPHPFHCQDMPDPVVSVKQNFDDLGFPRDHVGRTQHDSYYLNSQWMLRTHMTAHERELIQARHQRFLMAGAVFRRDEIDATHYPVFHQLEGVHILNNQVHDSVQLSEVAKGLLSEGQDGHSSEEVAYALSQLQGTLNGLLRSLFGSKTPIRWQPCYFPFTQPSMEAEVLYRGRWVEVLGSGLLQRSFLSMANAPSQLAWAFGLGLERLAMILYDIPDIRLFWSTDQRFLSQFDPAIPDEGLLFKPFSRYPHIARDLSFWISQASIEDWSSNSLYDLVRSVAGDLVESVELIDEFRKAGRSSQCFRITYRSMDRSLTDDEVNVLQAQIRESVEQELGVELR